MKQDARVTWTLSACTALALFGDATMYAVLPSQYAAMGLASVHVGWLLSVNRLVRPPLNFVSGWLCDRVGRKRPYVLGIGIGIISTACYGLVRGFWPLLALRALWGVAWALLAVAAYAMILDVSDESTRGRLTGTYASFSFLGGAVGPLLGGFLVDTVGFRSAMLVLGGCTAAGCVGAMSLPQTRSRAVPTVVRPLRAPNAASRLRSLRRSLHSADPRLWFIAGLNFVHRFIFAGVVSSTFGRYLLDTFGSDIPAGRRWVGVAAVTGALVFVRNLVTVAVGPLLGHLSDRLHDRPTVLLLGELVGMVALLIFGASQNLPLIVLGVAAEAVANAVVPPLLVAWMGDLSIARNRATLVGAYQTMGDLGSGLAPVLAYPVLEAIGTRPVYAISAGLVALTIPLLASFGRRTATATRHAEVRPLSARSADDAAGEVLDQDAQPQAAQDGPAQDRHALTQERACLTTEGDTHPRQRKGHDANRDRGCDDAHVQDGQ